MRKAVNLFLTLVFVACASSPVPKGVLPPDQMQKIVYDLIRTDEFINNFVIKDTAVDIKKKRSTLYAQVFKVNNTNRKEFYSSYKYYQQHPDIQKGLFDSLYNRLSRQKDEPDTTKTVRPVK